MKSLKLFVLVLAALFFLPIASFAQTTWVVDQGGAGDFTAIQNCIDAAAAGDTCQVNAGTYVRSLLIQKNLTLFAPDGPDVTIIKPGPPYPYNFFAGTITLYASGGPIGPVVIDGFKLTEGMTVAGGGIFVENSTLTVRNCIITKNVSGLYGDFPYTGRGGGGIYVYDSDLTVEDSVISNNTSRAAWVSHQSGAGIYAEGESSLSITNCLINGNLASHGGGAVYLTSSATALFTNCTIADNEDDGGVGGILVAATAFADVVNSILWNAGDEITAGASVHHSDVEGGLLGAGNIDIDPLFVGSGDYHLADGSPCIDAGYNGAAGLPATDIDGEPRVTDGDANGHAIVDMGADEVPAPPEPAWTAASTVPAGMDVGPSVTVNQLGIFLLPLAGILFWRGRIRKK